MGGGMVCGEPYDYGLRYPGYSSVFPPRRRSTFWGDESFPEEVTNLARKRKLDGVKGEQLGESNGKNVRQIFVEDSSKSQSSPTHALQGYGNAPTSCGNSPPASPPVRGGSRSSTEGHTVSIPVVFSSDATKQQPVPVVPQEGTKKPRRALSDEAAAVMIQSVFRGHCVRKTKPLEHMRKISSIRTKLKDFERQLSDASVVEKMRSDLNVRLRIAEGIMALLLQLDAIQGVHPDIRMWRKAVTKEVVTLQERVDILLKDGTEPASVQPPMEGHHDDTAMVVDDNAAEDHISENDDVLTETVHRESQPECRDIEDTCPEEIVLDQLKLEDGERACQSDEMAFVQDVCDVGECIGRASEAKGGECAVRTEQIGGRKEAVQNGVLVGRLDSEGNDNERQHTRSTSQVTYSHGAVVCETMDSTREPLSDESEMKTDGLEKSDAGPRGEECLTFGTDVTGHAEGGCRDAPVEIESSEAAKIEDASAIAEQGMEVDRERPSPQDHIEELAGKPEELECRSDRSMSYQERIKYLLKEIVTPSQRAARVSHCALLNGAEEMDCHGAPSSSSDLEENDGAPASSGPRTRDGNDGLDEGAEASGRTDKAEHDRLLLKLSEENKMLKSLLLDVMKWNQLQANSMRNVTERLEKLEDRLMAKQKKSGSKPKAQRCTRTRLERRLRR